MLFATSVAAAYPSELFGKPTSLPWGLDIAPQSVPSRD